MDHYVDIDVRPDPEFPANQLITALYSKLHRAFVAQDSTGIGVSFPGFDAKAPHLGNRLRLHGSIAALSSLFEKDWLTGIRDHIALQPALPVPERVQHRVVRRVQVKSNPTRLRRRLMRRHGIDEQTAQQRIPDKAARLTSLPFIQLHSASTGQTFKLFIDHGPIGENAAVGQFNAYGLSQSTTVPWF